jgi:cell division septal protein FtsQ
LFDSLDDRVSDQERKAAAAAQRRIRPLIAVIFVLLVGLIVYFGFQMLK